MISSAGLLNPPPSLIQWATVGTPVSRLSPCRMVLCSTLFPRHHMESLPVPLEEVGITFSHAISLQDLQVPGTLQGVVQLVQFKEVRVKYLLPHRRNLLEQFDIEVQSLRTATHPEPMKGFVVGDGGGEAESENHRHHLPHHLNNTYDAVVSSPF